MRPQSSKSTGRKSRSMKTSARSRRKATTPSTSSAEAFPAKTSASPEKELGWLEQGPVFGTSLLGLLASYDPDTSSWRTSQRSLLEEWAPFSATFQRSGMTRSGTLFQLQPLVRHTAVSASGSLPTPTTKSNQMCPSMMSRGVACRNLREAMWPTPKASAAGPDFAKVGRSKTGISLATAVAMFPTPAATDGKGAGKTGTLRDRLDYEVERGATKSKTYQQPPQDGGSLNPTWVEWLMGFPLGWTALDASETPSSRKSSRSSGGRSSRAKNG